MDSVSRSLLPLMMNINEVPVLITTGIPVSPLVGACIDPVSVLISVTVSKFMTSRIARDNLQGDDG